MEGEARQSDDSDVSSAALLLGTATSVGRIGTFRWDLASDQLRLSERAHALLGIRGVRNPTSRQLIERSVHPDDQGRAYELRDRSLSTADRVPAADWLVVDHDGQLRWVAMAMTPALGGDQPTEMLGSLLDVTERHDWRTERQIYRAAFTTLTSDAGAGTGTAALIAGLVSALGWEAGTLWLERESGVPTCGGHWSRSGAKPPSPPDGPWRPGVLVVPVRAGDRPVGSLELEPRDGRTLRPALDEAVRAVAGQLGDFLGRRGTPSPGESPLTARETEVLQLASHGGSSASIARRLVVSTSTIKTHFEHIYAKLGVADRAGAVAEALRHDLID